jgi:hypothetical protein
MNTPVTYTAEIDFLGRKLPTAAIKWQALPAKSELISPPLHERDAHNLIAQLKDALGEAAIQQAGVLFSKMIFAVSSKLQGGVRVAISIGLLRQVFGSEIDGSVGGGGRVYSPLSTRPGRGGGGV